MFVVVAGYTTIGLLVLTIPLMATACWYMRQLGRIRSGQGEQRKPWYVRLVDLVTPDDET